jgi:hypothetical protein
MACVALFGFVERILLDPRRTAGRGVRDHADANERRER